MTMNLYEKERRVWLYDAIRNACHEAFHKSGWDL